MEIKLFLLHVWWHCVPILVLALALIVLAYGFKVVSDISTYDIERALRAFLWFLILCVVVLALSSYRPDVALSVRPKINNIEQERATIKQEKIDKEQQEAEERERIASIHQELDEALSVAHSHKGDIWIEATKNDVINEEWLAVYREKIEELPDSDDKKENYKQRFDDMDAWFYPEGR